MKQKDVFLAGEGDAWFQRNATALSKLELPGSDSLVMQLIGLKAQWPDGSTPVRLLEVGCGAGHRLDWLQKKLGWECHGLDPSAQAVAQAGTLGVKAQVGTADQLPFADGMFDVVVFGFCLYLCDRDDLFRIAAEADRVLKNPGWLLIKDFFSPVPVVRAYHHKPGLSSYKMDYTSLFNWNPAYSTFAHRVAHHVGDDFTDEPQEWVATSVLRKCRQP